MATYYVWSGATGSANGSTWANAYTKLGTALSGKAAGDVFYVAHDHAETTAANIIFNGGATGNPLKVICVDRAGSVPPVSADRRATAQIALTGNFSLQLQGYMHYDGIIFLIGSGASGGSISIANTTLSPWNRFDNCSLRINSTTATAGMAVGTTTTPGACAELNNTTVSFGNVAQDITVQGMWRWRNTVSAVLGSIPTTLFRGNQAGMVLECIGVDLSAVGSGNTLVNSGATQGGVMRFIDCKLDAAVTKSVAQTGYGSCEIDFIRSGAAGVNYPVHCQRISGLLTEETVVVRSGGASDGTTTLSWKVVTTSTCTYSMPFETPPIAIWNDTTGSAVTATVEGIAAALPTDQEVWLVVEYLGDASSPQGSFVDDGKADLLATAANQTSSSETWGGSTAAFKLAVTFTPQQKGWIFGRIKIGKASSTLYLDPLIVLS